MFDSPTTQPITGSYDLGLGALSYVIAILSSFTALDILGTIKPGKRGNTLVLWRFAAAFAMGGGVWSMHFIAMLAFQLPMAVGYDVGVTCLSFVVAVLASGVAFYIVSLQFDFKVLIGGVFMGVGIATMHYVGMLAMLMDAEIHYDFPLFVLSILIAVGASIVALWLVIKFSEKSFRHQFFLKVYSAFLMGTAIVGMHYTGMAATIFIPYDNKLSEGQAVLDSTL